MLSVVFHSSSWLRRVHKLHFLTIKNSLPLQMTDRLWQGPLLGGNKLPKALTTVVWSAQYQEPSADRGLFHPIMKLHLSSTIDRRPSSHFLSHIPYIYISPKSKWRQSYDLWGQFNAREWLGVSLGVQKLPGFPRGLQLTLVLDAEVNIRRQLGGSLAKL